MCSYVTLWQCPIVLVGHSFGGIVIKSLVVEINKCANIKKSTIGVEATTNGMEATTNRNCKRFFEILKGMVFYIGVPHSNSITELPLYFAWQYQEINSINKNLMTSSSLSNNVGLFN
jgi:hypothetical protein